MNIKEIVEGMTAPQVAQVIKDNFNEVDKDKANKTDLNKSISDLASVVEANKTDLTKKIDNNKEDTDEKLSELGSKSAHRKMQGYADPTNGVILKGGDYSIYCYELVKNRPANITINVDGSVVNTDYIAFISIYNGRSENIGIDSKITEIRKNTNNSTETLLWFEDIYQHFGESEYLTLVITTLDVPSLTFNPIYGSDTILKNAYIDRVYGVFRQASKSITLQSVIMELSNEHTLSIYNAFYNEYVIGVGLFDSNFNFLDEINNDVANNGILKSSYPSATYIIATYLSSVKPNIIKLEEKNPQYHNYNDVNSQKIAEEQNFVAKVYNGGFVNINDFYFNYSSSVSTILYKLDRNSDIYINNIINCNEYIYAVVYFSDKNTPIREGVVLKNDKSSIYINKESYPTNAKYFAVSHVNGQIPQVINNEWANSIYNQDHHIQGGITVDIHVKKEGGNFQNLTQALLSINDSSKNKIYNVYIYEGEYDVIKERDDLGINRRYILQDYVNLIGVGDKKKIIINGTQTHSEDVDVIEVSTFDICKNNKIENLTMIGDNVRYVVHSDYYYNGGGKHLIEVNNCVFYHKGLYTQSENNSPQCWGCGSYNGKHMIFRNCEFTSVNGIAWLTHNRWQDDAQNVTGSTHEFYNCKFVNEYKNIDNYNRWPWMLNNAFGFQSWGSGLDENVVIVGCSSNLPMVLIENTWGSTNNGLDYKISGYANNIPIIYEINTDKPAVTPRNLYCAKFTDEGVILQNMSLSKIHKGSPVTINDKMGISGIASSLDDMYGIAYTDIEIGDTGYIKTKGYIHCNDINLDSINIGEDIQINEGVFEISDNGLKCKRKNFIYLLPL